MVTSTSLLSMPNRAHVPSGCIAFVTDQTHKCCHVLHFFHCIQTLVACSTEEYKAPGQPEQEVFQDGSGRTWDRCTVTGLFSSEVNYWSCDCSVAVSPARQLHLQRLLSTHSLNCILHPLQSQLYLCDQRIDSIVSGGQVSRGIHRTAKCCILLISHV